jgi:hypothetical protein
MFQRREHHGAHALKRRNVARLESIRLVSE